MTVILLRDVAKLGKRFSIVEVPDGYALNQLIPKGMAEAATPINLKRVQAHAHKVSHDKADELASFSTTVAALKDMVITIKAPANEQQHLFKAVKIADVAAALATEGHAVPMSAISLPEPIKSLGEYTVSLEFGGVKGSVQIRIISQ